MTWTEALGTAVLCAAGGATLYWYLRTANRWHREQIKRLDDLRERARAGSQEIQATAEQAKDAAGQVEAERTALAKRVAGQERLVRDLRAELAEEQRRGKGGRR